MVAVQETPQPNMDKAKSTEVSSQPITIKLTDASDPTQLAVQLKEYAGEEFDNVEVVFDLSGCKRMIGNNELLGLIELFIKKRTGRLHKLVTPTVKVLGMSPLLDFKHPVLAAHKVEEKKDDSDIRRKGIRSTISFSD